MSNKMWKSVKLILLLGTALAALKLIFVDYTLDEEYQIVMAYRNLIGDQLFKQMWEPHQTSAFFCSGLIWLYTAVTGTTTGVILFLRLVTLGIQVLLSCWVYRTLARLLEKDYAFLLALLYINIVPKNIQIPEFGNMQLWFLTVCVLCALEYYVAKEAGRAENKPMDPGQGKLPERSERSRDKWWLLVLAGVSLAGEVLTYPTCVILFPFFLIYILCKSGKSKWRDALILTGTCAVCGGIWLALVFRNVSLEEFLRNVENLLSFDPTHHVSGMTSAKNRNYIDNVFLWAGWLAVIAAVSGLICGLLYLIKKRRSSSCACGAVYPGNAEENEKKGTARKEWFLKFLTITLLVSEIVQIYYWAVKAIGYEYLQIHLLVLWLAAVCVWRMAGEGKKVLFWGIVATLVAYVGVMYISDLAMYYTLPHGALGIVFAAAVIVMAMQNVLKEKARPWILLLVISLCLCSIGGKAYTLRGGKQQNSILAVGGIMKDGPAAGILADYMCAHIYNCNYEDYAKYVQPGDNVLIVANMIMSVGTTAYLFDDVNISHFSIVDPTTYDEKLLTYWEQYPEKEPDVIVVDCWYGGLMIPMDSWIMQYIENDFGYSTVNDGAYVRFYRR